MEAIRRSVNDLAKACACSADAAEWEEFLRCCRPLTSLVVMRVARMWSSGSSSATIDDIVQEVFLKLCEQERRILRDFEPRGEDSFFGLLRVVAGSVANDYFRRLYSEKRGGKVVTMALEEETAVFPASHAGDTARMQKAVLMAQLDEKLRSAPGVVSERDRSVFWLYYLQGLTAEEIARISAAGLTAKGVESALRRVAKWLRGQVEQPGADQRLEAG
jgi:RNA polymerase sigma-70 factor (ECF subfamily)